MSKKKLRQSSALKIELSGSTGSFRVGARGDDQKSLLVKYFLTHIGLDFKEGTNEDILQHLKPVREMYNLEDLDFDQIMQRDIDDARVSGELIPYLLDRRSNDIIKLFPPIVVVILPNEPGQIAPASFYSKVEDVVISGKMDEYDTLVTRFGEVGSEELAFEEAKDGKKILNHDYARLKLNSNRTKLVIVDGQHRAMALLALYRNYKVDWSDEKRAPYQVYYQEWTKAYIEEFGLESINLPVLFCTFPDLDTEYRGDYTLPKAAREIFLTLNKTARKVSNTRNILLNDTDIIAHFLRKILSKIKACDSRSPHSMRIHNVELDQQRDRQVLTSPVAITGVSHVYYIVEHLMLNASEDTQGVSARRGKYSKRTDLDSYGMIQRLDGANLLGHECAARTRRDMYRSDTADTLSDAFMASFGESILEFFWKFKPLSAHNKAALDLQKQLTADGKSRLEPIFFEGQGNERVFRDHKDKLEERVKTGYFGAIRPPEVEAVLEQLSATAADLERYASRFRNGRAEQYFGELPDLKKMHDAAGKIDDTVLAFVNTLYLHVFGSVAFQAAVIGTFWKELEETAGVEYDTEIYSEYIEQLGTILTPTSVADFQRVVRIFRGSLELHGDRANIVESDSSFRKVVHWGEMQPDQWPKYRYLILEVWSPSDDKLAATVKASRESCRRNVFNALFQSRLKLRASELVVSIAELPNEDRLRVRDESYESFKSFLKNLKVRVADIATAATLAGPPDETTASEDENNRDGWDTY